MGGLNDDESNAYDMVDPTRATVAAASGNTVVGSGVTPPVVVTGSQQREVLLNGDPDL